MCNKKWYSKQGIVALTKDEIPGSDNVLITTMDNPDDPCGGIDTTEVDKIIKIIK